MIEIVKPGIRYGFIARSRAFMGLSAILVLGSILLLSTRGLNLGIDFKGGNKLILAFSQDAGADRDSIKDAVADLIRQKTGGAMDAPGRGRRDWSEGDIALVPGYAGCTVQCKSD